MFYTFIQRNPGGYRIPMDTSPPRNAHFTIIEANSADDANEKAEKYGIYFSGVRKGRDCECCGDRWSIVYDDDGTPEPTIWGDNFQDYDSVIISYMDGRVWFNHSAAGIYECGWDL